MDEVEVILVSPFYEEDLIAEVYYRGALWAIVKYRGSDLILELMTDQLGKIAEIPLNVAITSLYLAKGRIVKA